MADKTAAENEKQARLLKAARGAGMLLAAGLLYYAFVSATGFYVPCIFRLLTGWKCPGCGVSHLFSSLFAGDIKGAFSANPFVFVLLPSAALYTAWKTVRYVRTGKKDYSVWENRFFTVLAAAAVLFGIVRNL